MDILDNLLLFIEILDNPLPAVLMRHVSSFHHLPSSSSTQKKQIPTRKASNREISNREVSNSGKHSNREISTREKNQLGNFKLRGRWRACTGRPAAPRLKRAAHFPDAGLPPRWRRLEVADGGAVAQRGGGSDASSGRRTSSLRRRSELLATRGGGARAARDYGNIG